MKRKLFCMVLGLSLIMTTSVVPSLAFSELEGQTSISKQEAAEILSEKLDEAADVLDGENMDMVMCSMSDGSLYAVKTYDMGDGCTLAVELKD